MKPMDPVSENMNVLNGKPVKAFMYQDHEAHLQVHMAALQDPKIAAIVGQNPQAQAIQGAAMAHIMEHVAFQYRREMEKQLGATLPPPMTGKDDEMKLPEEMEVQLSQLAAQAAAKLLQKDIAEAQAQQAAQQAQDPLIQMQMQDLQIKQAEVERKKQKDLLDAASKEDALRLREMEIAGRQELEATKLGVDIQKHKSQMEGDGMRMGIDIAKAREAARAQAEKPQPKSKGKGK
jgi:hypothetical protein